MKLHRYDVLSPALETVFDAAPQFGPDHYIWQIHSSDDDRVHSATLRARARHYEMLGCLVYHEDTRTFSYFPKIGDFDECQVDKSGRWLLIKENVDGVYGEDNRIIDLEAGHETLFLDRTAPPAIPTTATATWLPRTTGPRCPARCAPGVFGSPLPGVPPQGQVVYHTTDWALDIGHISHANASAPGAARSANKPPAATGTMFSDVPLTHPLVNWIEQLAREGITQDADRPPTARKGQRLEGRSRCSWSELSTCRCKGPGPRRSDEAFTERVMQTPGEPAVARGEGLHVPRADFMSRQKHVLAGQRSPDRQVGATIRSVNKGWESPP